ADREDAAPFGKAFDEPNAGLDLAEARAAVGRLGAGLGGDGDPAARLVLEPEPSEGGADDRRRGLGRAGTRELALRGERDAAEAPAWAPGRPSPQEHGGGLACR